MGKPTLTVNLDTLNRLRGDQQWGVFAQQLGLSESTISRVRSGQSRPSPEFIAAVVTNCPVRIEDIVTVEEVA